MQSLLFQLSGVAALLVLLDGLWDHAPLAHTLVFTVAVGTTVYSVLLVAQATLRYVVTHQPAAGDADAPAPPAPSDAELAPAPAPVS